MGRNTSLLAKAFLIGAALQVSSCLGADQGTKPMDCEGSYDELVAELRSGAQERDYRSSYMAGISERAEELLSHCPNHVGLMILVANSKVSQQQNVVALGYASKALQIEPDNAQALNTKGMILSMMGQVEESLQLIKRSIEIDPQNVTFLINYCSALELFGRYEEAIVACSKAIEAESSPPVAHYIRGRAYAAIGQTEDAQLDFDKARALGIDLRPEIKE